TTKAIAKHRFILTPKAPTPPRFHQIPSPSILRTDRRAAGRKETKRKLLAGRFPLAAFVAGDTPGAMNSSKQALIYSFVAKGSVVLAEHTAFSGNFSTVAVQCLQKLPPNSTRSTYSCDGHTFNFLLDRGFVFLVVADEAAGRSVPFVFLERVREDFMQRYGSSIDEEGQHPLADDADEDDFLFEDRFSIAYNLDREFGPRLKDHMQYCVNHPEEINKLSKVKAHLSEVKGIMMDNIEKILDRGEKIELLVGKTETLQSQADSFHRHGRELRRKMWLQNLR
ncbi:unnamed protein product, partial [Urochloa humidicola]